MTLYSPVSGGGCSKMTPGSMSSLSFIFFVPLTPSLALPSYPYLPCLGESASAWHSCCSTLKNFLCQSFLQLSPFISTVYHHNVLLFTSSTSVLYCTFNLVRHSKALCSSLFPTQSIFILPDATLRLLISINFLFFELFCPTSHPQLICKCEDWNCYTVSHIHFYPCTIHPFLIKHGG